MNILKSLNLTKTFIQGNERLQVIKPTNIEFEKGTINIIMGESGSGKTTLLNLLAGIDQPTSGSVYFDGIDYYESSENKQSYIRGRYYGVVFQFFNLIPELTVKENIELPAIINKQEINKRYLKKLIEILNIQHLMKKRPTEISGGEQQRVAIARAMLLQPSIVFADEPTGNLDKKNSSIIVEALKEINDTFNTTLIIVTHDPNLFEKPDRKYIMSDGYLMLK